LSGGVQEKKQTEGNILTKLISPYLINFITVLINIQLVAQHDVLNMTIVYDFSWQEVFLSGQQYWWKRVTQKFYTANIH
jgi:hypothetical protein